MAAGVRPGAALAALAAGQAMLVDPARAFVVAQARETLVFILGRRRLMNNKGFHLF